MTSRLALLRKDGIGAVTGAATDRWFTEEFARKHPEKIASRIEELMANDLESYIEAYRVFGESEMAPRLHEITHPTLVLTGEFDIGSNTRMARFMHDTIPQSELVILPELKHSILVEASDLVADHLIRFFGEPARAS
ncbi:Beta-ketoadipate enol-lactone hydrolase [Lutibaculum baratangense AMV1]|uniref:Beta-ketoadipate enol-lactone hydrolase n=1 Tax=Lutibaculum baratangense AMV1 TaxID=631454 RepID=V4QZ77_9HYPH|nr:Beta-ketoadipate enol-lactone hydrolase [Lutibaculum baratangense AMV1]